MLKYTITERDDYIELFFTESIDLDDDQLLDQLDEELCTEFKCDVEDIDWRDDQTCWIWL